MTNNTSDRDHVEKTKLPINYSINEVAKLLCIKNVGQNKLFEILVNEKILYKRGEHYLPMQRYQNSNYFTSQLHSINIGDSEKDYIQVFVTPKGLKWLSKTLIKRGYEVQTIIQ